MVNLFAIYLRKYWVEKEIISQTYRVIFSLFQNQYIEYYSNIPIYKLFRIFSTFNVIIKNFRMINEILYILEKYIKHMK